MTNNVYYIINELISYLINFSNDGLIIAHFLLAEFCEFFAFLGYMIYLEIIELNFCGLNENLKKAIIEKGEDEFKLMTFVNNSENYRDDITEETN